MKLDLALGSGEVILVLMLHRLEKVGASGFTLLHSPVLGWKKAVDLPRSIECCQV